MKKTKLYLTMELQTHDNISDEDIYEAVSNQLCGKDGEGLTRYSGGGLVLAPRFEIEIHKQPIIQEAVWTISL